MHTRRPVLIYVAIMLALLAGCTGSFLGESGSKLIDAKNVQRLRGVEWKLRAISVDGSELVMHTDSRMSLRFDADGQLRGNGGVNLFSGGYHFAEDSTLQWDSPSFTLTRKAGPPEFRDKERVYLDALRRTSRAIASREMLTLQSENGEVVLTFLKDGAS